MTPKIDPFTRTPGLAGKAYIDTGIADTVIANFKSDESEKHVYKITGLRGSGKSVEYGRIMKALKEEKNWLVYNLSSAGNTIATFHDLLASEKGLGINNKTIEKSFSASLGGSFHGASGEGSVKVTNTKSIEKFQKSEEAAIIKMIETANKKKYRILVGIDDISKTEETVKLLSIIGSMIVVGAELYLVVTGLSENIEEFSTEKNLTFFKRADAIEATTLNKYDIVNRYQDLLGIDSFEAKKIEQTTRGYAYAYQVLGSLYFCKKENETLEDLMPAFENIMFKDSYDMIWQKLTEGEKEMVRCICKTKDGKTEDIKSLMKNPASYNVFRNNLINKHLVDGSKRGYLKINLPRFDSFVELWGDD